eukprot:250228-Chlamydomonas_euryale.AAC.1
MHPSVNIPIRRLIRPPTHPPILQPIKQPTNPLTGAALGRACRMKTIDGTTDSFVCSPLPTLSPSPGREPSLSPPLAALLPSQACAVVAAICEATTSGARALLAPPAGSHGVRHAGTSGALPLTRSSPLFESIGARLSEGPWKRAKLQAAWVLLLLSAKRSTTHALLAGLLRTSISPLAQQLENAEAFAAQLATQLAKAAAAPAAGGKGGGGSGAAGKDGGGAGGNAEKAGEAPAAAADHAGTHRPGAPENVAAGPPNPSQAANSATEAASGDDNAAAGSADAAPPAGGAGTDDKVDAGKAASANGAAEANRKGDPLPGAVSGIHAGSGTPAGAIDDTDAGTAADSGGGRGSDGGGGANGGCGDGTGIGRVTSDDLELDMMKQEAELLASSGSLTASKHSRSATPSPHASVR